MKCSVETVQTKRQMNDFLALPKKIYKDNN